MNKTAVIILASGLSERMGQPKPMLRWSKSLTFLEKIINEYFEASCSRIICMINKKTESFCSNLDTKDNVRFVVNHHPEWGRLYSIKTGIQEIADEDFCFIQNVDNPFVNIEIIEKLFENRDPEAWCSPVYKGKGGHPVLLTKNIIRKISEVEDLNYTLIDILDSFKRKNIEIESDSILRNINTPEDYLNFFS